MFIQLLDSFEQIYEQSQSLCNDIRLVTPILHPLTLPPIHLHPLTPPHLHLYPLTPPNKENRKPLTFKDNNKLVLVLPGKA